MGFCLGFIVIYDWLTFMKLLYVVFFCNTVEPLYKGYHWSKTKVAFIEGYIQQDGKKSSIANR